ncbi:hypothetical protein BH11ACT6_BH11ACT6_56920 [soil metagenome]
MICVRWSMPWSKSSTSRAVVSMVARKTTPKPARMVSLIAVTAACLLGCSESVVGTPQAEPGLRTTQTDTPSTSSIPTTTSRTPIPSGVPTVPPVPTRTTGPGPSDTPANAETTCDEYLDLDEDGQRAVIEAVGADNELVGLNPELWITLTSALCTFAEPSTPVREVLEGQGIR